jgi:hypothetical protein
VFRTPFDVDPVEQEPAGEGEIAPVAATDAGHAEPLKAPLPPPG